MTEVAPLKMVWSACVSLMMREMSSPLRFSLKNPADKFIRCAKSLVRRPFTARMAAHCRK